MELDNAGRIQKALVAVELAKKALEKAEIVAEEKRVELRKRVQWIVEFEEAKKALETAEIVANKRLVEHDRRVKGVVEFENMVLEVMWEKGEGLSDGLKV